MHPAGWLQCSDDRGLKIYRQLNQIIEQYGNAFYLRQSIHNFTPQTNEALNSSQEVVAPKAKVFHESRSFHYCHAIVIGTHNWGTRKFWTTVFSHLGIAPSQIFLSYLNKVGRKKSIQKAYHLNVATKQRRAHKQDACKKKLLYENRTAEYGSRIGLDIGNKTATKDKQAKKPAAKKAKRIVC